MEIEWSSVCFSLLVASSEGWPFKLSVKRNSVGVFLRTLSTRRHQTGPSLVSRYLLKKSYPPELERPMSERRRWLFLASCCALEKNTPDT